MTRSRPFVVALAAALAAGCALAPPIARPLDPTELAAQAAGGRTVFAIYTIGGDLEDDVDPEDGVPDEQASGQPQPKGANSEDLREIVRGLQAMAPAKRAKVDVFVMMGGSRKAGWRGMRALDGAALVRDAEDGYFGNLPDGAYLAKDLKASMADPSTLRRFFEMTKARANGATVIAEVAGHGFSYGGVGADTNQPDDKQWMALPALGKALADSQLQGAILAFPCCLMASVEVARAVGPRFRYLVGSEETMPGEGWNYATVFATLGGPVEGTAKAYADSLVDDPAHQYTDYKTCSVIDLPKAQQAVAALDAWAAGVGPAQRQAVIDVSRGRKAFGLDAPTDPAVSIDMVDYFGALAKRGQPAAAKVAAAAKAAVVHHRGDKNYAYALGMSIYPPHIPATTGPDANYDASVAASPAFWNLVEALRPLLPPGRQAPAPKRRQRPGSR